MTEIIKGGPRTRLASLTSYIGACVAIHSPFIPLSQTTAFTMQLICSNTKSFICLLESCDITVEGQPERNNKPTETTGWEMHQAQPEDTANAAAQENYRCEGS